MMVAWNLRNCYVIHKIWASNYIELQPLVKSSIYALAESFKKNKFIIIEMLFAEVSDIRTYASRTLDPFVLRV